MKQYCRYCAHCFEADDFRCSDHPRGLEPHWNRQQINKENHCPNFVLSELGDVETGKQYRPRIKGLKRRLIDYLDKNQTRMEI